MTDVAGWMVMGCYGKRRDGVASVVASRNDT